MDNGWMENGLSGCGKWMESGEWRGSRSHTIHACDRQTDRQTDGQTEFSSQYRVCITCSAV